MSFDRIRDSEAIRLGAVVGSIAPRAQLAVAGADRAAYLQGLLTNDIQALQPGTGCYAAWLTPQGRMITDLHVLQGDTMALLDVPADLAEPVLQRLDQFLFAEDVQLQSLAEALSSVWVHGPLAPEVIERVLEGAAGLAGWPMYHHERLVVAGGAGAAGGPEGLGGREGAGGPEGPPLQGVGVGAGVNAVGIVGVGGIEADLQVGLPDRLKATSAGPVISGVEADLQVRLASPQIQSPVVVARIDQLVVPGFVLYIEPTRRQALVDALVSAGAVDADPEALEAARIESGYPVFGIDMTDDTIPLEAGIEDRAISFSKGCYVGQEVVIRVLHRGGGRVARKLVGLRVDGDVPARGAKLYSPEREVGFVTSAAVSPRLGTIALGYVHRDFVEPGTSVEVDAGGNRVPVTVTARPLQSAA